MVLSLAVALVLTSTPLCAGMPSDKATHKMRADGWTALDSTVDTCGSETEAKWKCRVQLWVNRSGAVSYAPKGAASVLMFNGAKGGKWRLHRVLLCPLGTCSRGSAVYEEDELPRCK